MKERSGEEQPPKLKTYSLEMTLIKSFPKLYHVFGLLPIPRIPSPIPSF